MSLKQEILLLIMAVCAPVARSENNGVLNQLEVPDLPFQRRSDASDVCDDLIETCTEWEDECLEWGEECSIPYTDEPSDCREECDEWQEECRAGYESVCTESHDICVDGFENVCVAWDMTPVCKSLGMFGGWMCDWVQGECKSWTRGACLGWETVCDATAVVCKAALEPVCVSMHLVCDGTEKVCHGTTELVCRSYGQVCKNTGYVCQGVVGTVEALIEAVEDLGECLDDAFSGSNAGFWEDGCDVPVPNVQCYASANGQTVLDGFEAGCTLPTLTTGVTFGAHPYDEEPDVDTAIAFFAVGDLQLEIPFLKEDWEKSPMKENLFMEAATNFTFVGDLKMETDGEDFDLTIPGVKWDFHAGVTLYASSEMDPCEEDIDKCRIVLNKGQTTLYQATFAAGPIPVTIQVEAEVYLGAYPKFEGLVMAELDVFLADDGVIMLQPVLLPLHDPEAAMDDIWGMLDIDSIMEQVLDKLRVQVGGTLMAHASLELCVGVKLGAFINGIGAEMDIPICLTAGLDVMGFADTTGAVLEIGASLVLNPLAFPFELHLPDVSALVDTACGVVQAPMDMMSSVTDCVPVVSCFEDFVDDTCDGIADAVSSMDITVDLGTLTAFGEFEIWSDTILLTTASTTDDSPDAGIPGVSGSTSGGCSMFKGDPAMDTGLLTSPEDYPQAEEIEDCQDLCLSTPDCDIFVWYGGQTYAQRCIMMDLATARSVGREFPDSWPENRAVGATAGRCNFWTERIYRTTTNPNADVCEDDDRVEMYNSGTLDACKTSCEANPDCTAIYFSEETTPEPQCQMYRECKSVGKAALQDGMVYELTDAVFDLKAKTTWLKTGCPRPITDTSFYQKFEHAVGTLGLLTDMYNICEAVRTGNPGHTGLDMDEMKSMCCGERGGVPTECIPATCVQQEYWAGDGGYELVFRQTAPYEWPAGLLSSNYYENYAQLDDLWKFDVNGFNFKLSWPRDETLGPDLFYTWSQTSNPLTDPIEGYVATTVPYTGHNWGGLEPSNEGDALMDGSVNSDEWHYAIGAQRMVDGGIPAYAKSDEDDQYTQERVELRAYKGYRRWGGASFCGADTKKYLGTYDDVNDCAQRVLVDGTCGRDFFSHDPRSANGSCYCLKYGQPSCFLPVTYGRSMYQFITSDPAANEPDEVREPFVSSMP